MCDDDHSATDLPYGQEPVLLVTVRLVVDQQVIGLTFEQDPDVVEAQAMLRLIRAILLRIPLHPHRLNATPLTE